MILSVAANLARLDDYIPIGFLCGFPFVIQILAKYIPTLKHNFPLLPVRLAECLVGKASIAKLFLLFPAHFLGSVIGLVWFRTMLPFVSRNIMNPVYCSSESTVSVLIIEFVSNFVLAAVLLVLPYVLEVNRLSEQYINILLLPLFMLSGSSFNPSLIFGLWALNSSILTVNSCALNVLRISGSCFGALVAGWFCGNYFPDDASSWTRSSKKTH
jgi:hypothetical protein